MQYRSGAGKVFELESAGKMLDVHVIPRQETDNDGEWRVTAQDRRGGDATVITEWGDTRGEALEKVSRARVERLNRTLALVPYRKPVIGEVEFTSGFGVRTDPFLGRPAMHTGLDFRASTGDPVRATANGNVVSSGWAGGYGRMVEIDHGNGLSTRYGHLSEIHVKIGDQIRIGQVIGAVGSTGRST